MRKPLGLRFSDTPQESIVYMDGKSIGTIRCKSYGGGWFYQPKGSRLVGETMYTREAVKESLKAS